jgi:hypothetical protein
MKTIENKKIIVTISDEKWAEYLDFHNGSELNARCRVLTEAMKKLDAMKNPMEKIPDFSPEYITVERVHGTIHSPGYPAGVKTKSNPTIRGAIEDLYDESHGGGRFAHLDVKLK